MMVQKVFSIWDSKACLYSAPFVCVSTGVGIRAFTSMVCEVGSNLAKYPGDYGLFHLGSFDDVTGVFTNEKMPAFLGLAQEFKENR